MGWEVDHPWVFIDGLHFKRRNMRERVHILTLLLLAFASFASAQWKISKPAAAEYGTDANSKSSCLLYTDKTPGQKNRPVAILCREYVLHGVAGSQTGEVLEVLYPIKEGKIYLTGYTFDGTMVEWDLSTRSATVTKGGSAVSELYVNDPDQKVGISTTAIAGAQDAAMEKFGKLETREQGIGGMGGEKFFYGVVKVGTQFWLNRNISQNGYRKSKIFANKEIKVCTTQAEWSVDKLKEYARMGIYENKKENRAIYGGLYNFSCSLIGYMGPYEVDTNFEFGKYPTKEDWQVLIDYVGEHAEVIMANTSWNGGTVNPNGESGFEAFAAGIANVENTKVYEGLHEKTMFWTKTEVDADKGWAASMDNASKTISLVECDRKNGYSIRFLYNCEVEELKATPTPPTEYKWEFVVKDADGAVDDATIKIAPSGTTLTTAGGGKAHTIVEAGTYSYTITKNGYEKAEGKNIQINAEKTETVTLVKKATTPTAPKVMVTVEVKGSDILFHATGKNLEVDPGSGTWAAATPKNSWNPADGWYKVAGINKTLKIRGDIETLSFEGEKRVTRIVKVQADETLTSLNFANNLLSDLILKGTIVAPGLKAIYFKGNPGLKMINLEGLSQLETISFGMSADRDNPKGEGLSQLTSLYIDQACRPRLKSIDGNGAEISQFDFSGLRALKTLNASHWASVNLTGLESLENLDISNCGLERKSLIPTINIHISHLRKLKRAQLKGNSYKGEIAFTDLPDLTLLNMDGCKVDRITLSNLPNLHDVSLANNNIQELDLSTAPNILRLNVSDNKLESLDLTMVTKIGHLDVGNNALQALVIKNCTALSNLTLSGNGKLEACALNVLFTDLPVKNRKGYFADLKITGTKYETSKTSIASEKNWWLDVEGDGTAVCEKVRIKYNKTPAHGKVQIVENSAAATPVEPDGEVQKGMTLLVRTTPDAGYGKVTIKVNGDPIMGNTFTAKEETTVEVTFEEPTPIPPSDYVVLTVEQGYALDISVGVFGAAGAEKGPIYIKGESAIREVQVNGLIGMTSLDPVPVAQGTTLEIHGDLRALRISTERISQIDLSHAPKLQKLIATPSPTAGLAKGKLASIDLARCKNLQELDLRYNNLTAIDLTGLVKLKNLVLYENDIPTLDLSPCTALEKADLKNMNLQTITFSGLGILRELNIQNNAITTLNTTGLGELAILECNGNSKLTSLMLGGSAKLEELSINGTALAGIDLSASVMLRKLSASQVENLKAIDLHANTALTEVTVEDNAWTACELDAFYYTLPTVTSGSLKNKGTSAKANQAAQSSTSTATQKGWNVNTEGSGDGCDTPRVYILSSDNGTISLSNGGTIVESGNAIAKNTILSVEATPKSGYRLQHLLVNGTAQNDMNIVINKLTEVQGVFISNSAIKWEFDVKDNNGPVEGATIAIKGNATPLKTDTHGHAEIMTNAGVYSYTVTMAGYEDYTKEDVAVNANKTEDITLTAKSVISPKRYTINFVVTDGKNAIEGAEITISGVATKLTTDTKGKAKMPNLEAKKYSYSVKCKGFEQKQGEFTLVDKDLTEAVTLTAENNSIPNKPIEAESTLLAKSTVSPNPFHDVLVLRNAEQVIELCFYNMVGQKVLAASNLHESTIRIQTGSLPAGSYVLTLRAVDGQRAIRVVKR